VGSPFVSLVPAIVLPDRIAGEQELGVGAVVHGRAGQGLQQLDDWAWSGTVNARRGAFWQIREVTWRSPRWPLVLVFADPTHAATLAGCGRYPI
jgi:hypothetical protein